MSAELSHRDPAEKTEPLSQRRQQIWPVTPPSSATRHAADFAELDRQLTVELPQGTHLDVLKRNTGWALPPATWAKQVLRYERRSAETQRIATILVRAGVNVYRGDNVTYVSMVTDIVEDRRSYRSICILPEIAARERQDMVHGFQLFMKEYQNRKYVRYAVMTADAPVAVGGDLRDKIQQLSRRISKWSDYVEKWDMKVLFRGIEFTRMTAEERNMEDRYNPDTILYHVHANVIYEPTRILKSSEWKEFLKFTKSHVGGEWSDNDRIRNAEQVIKYCTKPADTSAAADEEIVWLYHQTARLKMCQPLGDFKVWRQTLKKRGEKVAHVHVHVGGGKGRHVRVKKSRCKGHATAIRGRRDDRRSTPASPHEDGGTKATKNVFLGITQPVWRHSPFREPLMMFINYDPSTLDDGSRCAIEKWRQEIRGWWDAAHAPMPHVALGIAKTALKIARLDEGEGSAQPGADYILDLCRATVRDKQSDVGSIPYVEPDERVFEDQKMPRSPTGRDIMEGPNAMERLKMISDEADQQRSMAERRLRGLPKREEAEARQKLDRESPAGKSVVAALMAEANGSSQNDDPNLIALLSAIRELSEMQMAA